ncbi:DUF4190 domain-containing protein [Micromonospora sp. STR1s_6]|uniref:DUF4190 domain-containing protein n=1 Tax=Micromonospora tarensis TaxID=2806100 RepID=A0ABS1YMJ1_9ACTN|nr:DUF4190 domain-containing protein [Micromonospora tarensis]
MPSLSRRSEPAPTRDENLDGRVDGRDTPVTDRDAEQTTYGSGADQVGEAERRASERAAVARAATARPVDPDSRTSTTRPVDPDTRASTTRPVDPDTRASTAQRVDPDTRPGGARPVDADARAAAARPVDTDTRAATPTAELDSATRHTDTTDRVTTDRPVDPTPDRTAPEPPVTRGPKPRASLLATLGLIVSVAGALFVLTGTLAGYGIGLGALGAVLSVLGLMATRRRHVAGKTDALFGMLIGLAAVVIGVLAMTGRFDWPTTDGDWVQRFREWLDSQFVDRF